MAGAYEGLNVRRYESLAVMTLGASLKSGCHGDHREMFLCVCEGSNVGIQSMGMGTVLGRRGHLSYWEKEEEGKGGATWG